MWAAVKMVRVGGGGRHACACVAATHTRGAAGARSSRDTTGPTRADWSTLLLTHPGGLALCHGVRTMPLLKGCPTPPSPAIRCVSIKDPPPVRFWVPVPAGEPIFLAMAIIGPRRREACCSATHPKTRPPPVGSKMPYPPACPYHPLPGGVNFRKRNLNWSENRTCGHIRNLSGHQQAASDLLLNGSCVSVLPGGGGPDHAIALQHALGRLDSP